ncbi:hypothetical protein BDZ97DRAFT_1916969 [Flammula alnicola]|nr:hypothetical protein BDZ97DRAFT_1916969 [Flammula alnicola]
MSRNRSHRNSSDFRVQDTSQGHVIHQWHQCDENTTSEHVPYGYQSQTVAPHTYPWRQPLIHPNAETLRQPGAYYPGEYYSSVPPALPPQLTNTLDPPYQVNDAVNSSQLGAPYGYQFIGSGSNPHLHCSHDPHHPYIGRATAFQDSAPPKPLPFPAPTQTGDYGDNSNFPGSVDPTPYDPNIDDSGVVQDPVQEVIVLDCPDSPASTASSGCSQDMNFWTNVKPETTMLVDCLLVDLSTTTGDIRMRVNRLLRRDLKMMEDAHLTAQAMGCMIDKIGRGTTPFPATFKNKMRKI